MHQIDLEITPGNSRENTSENSPEKFDEISSRKYSQITAKNLAENPFDFYEEKGSNLVLYFSMPFLVLFTALAWPYTNPIVAFVIAATPAIFLGQKLSNPVVRLINRRQFNKCCRIATKLKQPVFITAHSQEDDTVYERKEFAQEVLDEAFPDSDLRPRPDLYYFYPNDQGRNHAEYREWVDLEKVKAYKAYHHRISVENRAYYEAHILNQKGRPWEKVAK